MNNVLHTSGTGKGQARQKFRLGMILVTIGIVYGDIGTSPMYVMKSILEGNGGIGQTDEAFIIGSLSLVIWTITLLTTIKYVLIAMKADNHGEGGIFSLYSLVKNCGKWLIFPAMLGGSALLVDGVLTPAVTVTTAVGGHPAGSAAPSGDPLSRRHQGSALHRQGQPHPVDRLQPGGTLLPLRRPDGVGLRSGHHRDHADDYPSDHRIPGQAP